MNKQILDCTLRDGGYVNNWEFDTKTSLAIMSGLYDSGVRYIEIGIMGANAKAGAQTKFNDFSEMEPLFIDRKKDCHYAVMTTTENAVSFELPVCSEKTPDIIRLAYFKRDCENALKSAKLYQEKGYSVFLQAMATFMYSDNDIKKMIEAVNKVKPSAFYMVDSFSTMYPNDVAAMRDIVLNQLSSDISFGFHAHNNIQMAYANIQEFMNINKCQHHLFVDSSIYGMGRGAGNVPTELIMEYFNRNEKEYDVSYILSLYRKYLEPIYQKYGWGYTLPYFLTAVHKTNSAYGWYFMDHGLNDLDEINIALEKIPDDIRFTLNRKIADKIIDEVKSCE